MYRMTLLALLLGLAACAQAPDEMAGPFPMPKAGGAGGQAPMTGPGGAGGAASSKGGAGGAMSGGSGGQAGSAWSAGAAGAPQCAFLGSSPACTACVTGECKAECAACSANPECVALVVCLQTCGDDLQCANQCPKDHPAGAADMLAFTGKGAGCVEVHCQSECGSAGAAGSAGSGNAGAAGSGSGGTAEATCLQRINQARQAAGVPALVAWPQQESCADSQAQAYSQGSGLNPAACGGFGVTACGQMPVPAEDSIDNCIELLLADANAGAILETASYTQVACGFYTAGTKVFMTQFFH